MMKRVTSPTGLQIIGLVVIATGIIDATKNETAQAWTEVMAGAAVALLGWALAQRQRR
jgi:hypothetical protein